MHAKRSKWQVAGRLHPGRGQHVWSRVALQVLQENFFKLAPCFQLDVRISENIAPIRAELGFMETGVSYGLHEGYILQIATGLSQIESGNQIIAEAAQQSRADYEISASPAAGVEGYYGREVIRIGQRVGQLHRGGKRACVA